MGQYTYGVMKSPEQRPRAIMSILGVTGVK